MKSISWKHATPQYDSLLSECNTALLYTSNYDQFQHRLNSAINQFSALKDSRLLVVKAPDNTAHRELIASMMNERGIATVATSTISAEELFGVVFHDKLNNKITNSTGLLQHDDAKVIVISSNFIIANPLNWLRIKSLIAGESINPSCKDPSLVQSGDYKFSVDTKFIVVGDRNQMAELDYIDHEIFSALSIYSEFESELKLAKENVTDYIGLINRTCEQLQLPKLSLDAIKVLFTTGARECEEQHFVPLCPIWLTRILSESAQYCDGERIENRDIEKALHKQRFRESYITNRALDDILDGQVLIETHGSKMGQVNGLTVVEISGHPNPYGEPARISCVVHFGDGDIADVERKADLGGNLHAKGMMIMQAFLSSELKLEEPLPFAASIVFEQSYSEVDGDSASLAELSALVSALSEIPINQEIAVTGAVDQFGRVQAVGGLNEKIEGFYYVCAHQGFSGSQGVIIPKSNLRHLALHDDVLESIKQGHFHIWAVDNVEEALAKLMGKPFKHEEEESILEKIATRIDRFHHLEPGDTMMSKIKGWFN